MIDCSIRNINFLSLLSNFLGFFISLAGLCLLTFGSDLIKPTWGISSEGWWVFIFCAISIVLSFAVFLSPDGTQQLDDKKIVEKNHRPPLVR